MRHAHLLLLSVLAPALAAAQTPTALFGWAMHDRFVAARPGELMDFHWNAGTERYNPDHVHPKSWLVDLDACASSNAASFKWEIHGMDNAAGTIAPEPKCRVTQSLPFLGTYRVTLTVTGTDGTTASTIQDMTLRDMLIVSLGDSYAAGDGAPEKWQTFDKDLAIGPWRPIVTVTAGPKWQDPRCLRSGRSGPAVAALDLEASDPHASVTFLSFACAGAASNEGILHGYAGSVPRSPVLPSQLEQVRVAVGSSTSGSGVVRKGRRIDALIISIGGNDLGFAPIAVDCATNDLAAHLYNDDPLHRVVGSTRPYCDGHPELLKGFHDGLPTLMERYDSIAGAIRETLNVDAVYITEYPDPTHANDGSFCGSSGHPRILYNLDQVSAKWAHDSVVVPLDSIVRRAAVRNKWIFVDGIASQFATHGECAEGARWITTEEDARFKQGPWSPIAWAVGRTQLPVALPIDVRISAGTLHPNEEGYKAYARRIAYYVKGRTQIAAKASLSPGAHTGVPTTATIPTTVTIHVQDFFGKPLRGTVHIEQDPAPYSTDTPIPQTFHGEQQHSTSGELYHFSVLTDDNRTAFGNFSVPIGKITAQISPVPVVGQLTTVTVTAVDAQTGLSVPGAKVYVNATEQAPANKAFPYWFKCQRRGGRIPLMVCDEVVVSAPDFRDVTVNWKEVDPP